MVQEEKQGASSAQETVGGAIRETGRLPVIMRGVCPGLHPEKQKHGDILVSTGLASYDPGRMQDDKEMGGGEISEPGPQLSKAFNDDKTLDWEVEGVSVSGGLVV